MFKKSIVVGMLALSLFATNIVTNTSTAFARAIVQQHTQIGNWGECYYSVTVTLYDDGSSDVDWSYYGNC